MTAADVETPAAGAAGRRRDFLVLGGVLAALAVLFWEALGNLWMRWGGQQELSHSYFIPLISLWLVWINRERVLASVGDPSWAGLGIVALGLSSHIVGQLTSIFVFQHVGLVIVIAGLVAAFGGLSLLRCVAAPVAFLFFAVPPPFWVITVLSWKFQLVSSVIGAQMLEAMNVPVYLSGNVIDLGDYKLQVAEACSGLRYLFPFLSIGVIAAYMYRGPLWHKAVIVAAIFPITILMNSFRIAATGLLVQNYGIEHAEGALHFFEGWVVFLICLATLFGVIALLGLFSKPRQNAFEALSAPELPQIAPTRTGVSRTVALGTAGAFAAGFIGLSQIVNVDSLIIPERKPFAEIPSEFSDWRSQVRPIDPTVAEVLGADDSIVVDLQSPEGHFYNLYMAYLNAQRDGRSWHSPRQCIPGGGWKIARHDIVETTTQDGRPFAYNRLIIESGNHRQLVYYWYDQRGRKVANEFVMKFWLVYDAVFRQRSDGAMVRLIAPVTDGASVAEADERLKALMRRMEGFLPDYVPE